MEECGQRDRKEHDRTRDTSRKVRVKERTATAKVNSTYYELEALPSDGSCPASCGFQIRSIPVTPRSETVLLGDVVCDGVCQALRREGSVRLAA